MADLTIAVSEAVCAKTLEVVVANFGFDVSDQADFGAFRVGYDGRLFLKGGSLALRDDGTIRLRELDARWDKLDFSLTVKLPEISFGGGVVEVPLGSILLPGTGIFSGGKTVTFTVHLAPFVKHEEGTTRSCVAGGQHDYLNAVNIGGANPEYSVLTDAGPDGSRERHWGDQWHFALSRMGVAAWLFATIPACTQGGANASPTACT